MPECGSWVLGVSRSLFVVPFLLGIVTSNASADGGADHQQDLLPSSPPLVFGTTGGNIDDRTNIFCCGGTLGAWVTDGSNDLILSNNHVLARTNLGLVGDPILHPGLIDQSPACSQDTVDTVATLADFREIFFDGLPNTVDAAIATITINSSNWSSDVMDIGPVGSLPATPSIGDTVQKSGRTTGHTIGTLAAINVTLEVAYSKECGKGRQKAIFVDQLRVDDSHGDFSASGDSGSVVFTNDSFVQPVGLLFAGGGSSTFLNPIQEVFDCLAVDMGSGNNPSACAHPTSAGGGGDDDGGGGGNGKGPPWTRGGGGFDVPFGLQVAAEIKAANDARLMALSGVVGTGLSVDENGDPVIELYLDSARRAPGQELPTEVEGIPVRTIVTGEIVAE